jgi:hypothetical protein
MYKLPPMLKRQKHRKKTERKSPRTSGTFGFARHSSQRFAKPKEPFFANARQNKELSNFKSIKTTI